MEEVQEWPGHGGVEPAHQAGHSGVQVGALAGLLLNLVGNVLGRGKVVYPGLAHDQHGDRANAYQQCHDFVGHLPGPEFSQIQCPGTGYQQGQSVAEDIGGCQGRLQSFLGDFNSVGVDRHILGGGRKRHQQTTQRHHFRGGDGIHMGHQVQPGGDARLGQQDPATALSQQPIQQRQLQPVHHRCPEHLDGIGDAQPAEEADGGGFHAHIRQTRVQRGKHQQERQASRKTQKQQGNDLPTGVGVERIPEQCQACTG